MRQHRMLSFPHSLHDLTVPAVQDPAELYLELAEHVRKGLAHVDPYFVKLADGMIAWIAAWRQLNPDGIPDIK